MQNTIESLDWTTITDNMNNTGYALLPSILTNEQCNEMVKDYDNPALYRKTITMERYRFGLGEYKYFRYPLPELIQTIRTEIYPRLSSIANGWMKVLHIDNNFPGTLDELHTLCKARQQTLPTVLILKYGQGGHNTLHQDLYGDIFFPIQLVLFLNEPGIDYSGGEFVLVQQTPRAQSKAIVLQPRKGDMLLFTTNFRPVKNAKTSRLIPDEAPLANSPRGYYRVNMKHGVSEVHKGQRHTLGIIFHDAQ